MSRFVFLDSTPLSLLTYPQRSAEVVAIGNWLADLIKSERRVLVPAIVYYELKRELLRAEKPFSIGRLDAFVAVTGRYVPLTDGALRLAADLWAKSRREGKPTADVHALDIDVILAAQVLSLGVPVDDVVVATSNEKHLAQFVPATSWENI